MNILLTLNDTETFTREEMRGTPEYFGKVEWFDVVDRESGALLPWTVSRVDGKKCVVNHPTFGVVPELSSLQIAAELVHAQRMEERRSN